MPFLLQQTPEQCPREEQNPKKIRRGERAPVIVLPMAFERNSLVEDLADTVRSQGSASSGATEAPSLAELEAEHRLLSERRRRLHESIDLLDGLGIVKPDAAARLERYRITEKAVSRRRGELYRRIGELQLQQSRPLAHN